MVTTRIANVPVGALLPITRIFLEIKTAVLKFVPCTTSGRRPGSLVRFITSSALIGGTVAGTLSWLSEHHRIVIGRGALVTYCLCRDIQGAARRCGSEIQVRPQHVAQNIVNGFECWLQRHVFS